MKFNTFMLIYAVVSLLFGVGFVLAPALVLSVYGVDADLSFRYIGQLLGAALISLGVLSWSVRSAGDSDVRKAVLSSLLVGEVIGFVLAVIGQITGAMNVLGWSVVFVYLLFSAGLAYFRFVSPAR
jgi:hypothetical protein